MISLKDAVGLSEDSYQSVVESLLQRHRRGLGFVESRTECHTTEDVLSMETVVALRHQVVARTGTTESRQPLAVCGFIGESAWDALKRAGGNVLVDGSSADSHLENQFGIDCFCGIPMFRTDRVPGLSSQMKPNEIMFTSESYSVMLTVGSVAEKPSKLGKFQDLIAKQDVLVAQATQAQNALVEFRKQLKKECTHEVRLPRTVHVVGGYYDRSYTEYLSVCTLCGNSIESRPTRMGSYG